MKPAEKADKKLKTVEMMYISLFAALIAVCSWVSIPATVPFTMQTFGIFCVLGTLGGKRGAISVIVYVLLGLIGAPVFAGFSGGAGVLFGATGGYIIGFIMAALIYWLITAIFGEKTLVMAIAMLAGLWTCYAFGTAWFMIIYANTTGDIGLATALGWCVFPFIIPDIIKISLAIIVSKKIPTHLKV